MLIMSFACTGVGRCGSAARRYLAIGVLLLSSPVLAARGQSAMPPEPERQLAREIYKEMVEIKSGYTTGSTTPVAEAVGAPAPSRRIPGGRHLRRRRRSPPRPTSSSATAAPGARKPLLLLAHTDVVEAKREDWTHGPVHVHREGRLLLRPRHWRRQGAGRRLDRQPHPLQARRASSPTATSSSRSPPTKKAAAPTTASTGC